MFLKFMFLICGTLLYNIQLMTRVWPWAFCWSCNQRRWKAKLVQLQNKLLPGRGILANDHVWKMQRILDPGPFCASSNPTYPLFYCYWQRKRTNCRNDIWNQKAYAMKYEIITTNEHKKHKGAQDTLKVDGQVGNLGNSGEYFSLQKQCWIV